MARVRISQSAPNGVSTAFFLSLALSTGESFLPSAGVNPRCTRVAHPSVAPIARSTEECDDQRCTLFERDTYGRAKSPRGQTQRRRSTALQARRKRKTKDDLLNLKNIDSLIADDMKRRGDEIEDYLSDLDPNSEEANLIRYTGDGYCPSEEWKPPEYEARLPESFLVVCLDRSELPEEEINEPFWGYRIRLHLKHMEWSRLSARDLTKNSLVMFDRSIMSGSKKKVIGNLMCIHSKSKEEAERFIHDGPFYKAGLYDSVTFYRWPYSTAGGLNHSLSAYPYYALCIDGPDRHQLRKDTRKRHLQYLEDTRRVTGAGPLFKADASQDPGAKPVGSIVFFTADSDESAEAFVNADPYNEAGLFESKTVARFNDLNVDGRGMVAAAPRDPLREFMEEEEIIEEDDIHVDVRWRPSDSLAWLEAEYLKHYKDEYIDQRQALYDARDKRIEDGRVNEGAEFRPGAYVYMGPRKEEEWYDYWPIKFTLMEDGGGVEPFPMERSIVPVDIYKDKID